MGIISKQGLLSLWEKGRNKLWDHPKHSFPIEKKIGEKNPKKQQWGLHEPPAQLSYGKREGMNSWVSCGKRRGKITSGASPNYRLCFLEGKEEEK